MEDFRGRRMGQRSYQQKKRLSLGQAGLLFCVEGTYKGFILHHHCLFFQGDGLTHWQWTENSRLVNSRLKLVELKTSIRLGIKSRFGIMNFSTGDTTLGLWFFSLTMSSEKWEIRAAVWWHHICCLSSLSLTYSTFTMVITTLFSLSLQYGGITWDHYEKAFF